MVPTTMLARLPLRQDLSSPTSSEPNHRRMLKAKCMRILLIRDDDKEIEEIEQLLKLDGHHVEAVTDGRTGLRNAVVDKFDVMIIDCSVPDLDGLSIVKALRETHVETPILLLTAVAAVEHRVEALETGADDCLVRPWAAVELKARVQALGRRSAIPLDAYVLKIADLEINLLTRLASRGGRKIMLAPREFRLLEALMRNSGCYMTRKTLLKEVWGFHFETKTTIVQTFVSRLRSKIDRDFEHRLLHTVRGRGYSIHEPRN